MRLPSVIAKTLSPTRFTSSTLAWNSTGTAISEPPGSTISRVRSGSITPSTALRITRT